MKHTMLSLLTVALLLSASLSNTASASRPTCGTDVNGHTLPGAPPTHWCATDDLPVFPPTAHVYPKNATICPIDQAQLTAGHSE